MTIFRFTVKLEDFDPMVIEIPEVNKNGRFRTTPEVLSMLGTEISKRHGFILLLRGIVMEEIYVREKEVEASV